MRILKRMSSALLCSLLLVSLLSTALAKGEEYTYRITFHAGNQGSFVRDALSVKGSGYKVDQTGDTITVSGLHQGDRVIWDDDCVELSEGSRYYVRGVRLSGRDNKTVDATSFTVQEDRDYVVAYGIKADSVSYQVNYQDENGKELHRSRTLYGNVGDKPIAAAVYIDGYLPQAWNLTGTLKEDESQNVFTFVYRAVETTTTSSSGTTTSGTTTTTGGTTTSGTTGTTNSGTTTNGTTNNGTTNGGTTDNGTTNNGTTDNGTTAEGNDAAQQQTETPVPAQTEPSQATTPEEVPELIDIDDGEVPLAGADAVTAEEPAAAEKKGSILLPTLAVLAAAAAAGYLWWRHKSNPLEYVKARMKKKDQSDETDN